MAPRKQEKERNKEVSQSNLTLILLSSAAIILLSAVIACLINIQQRDELKIIQNVTESEALVDIKNEVKGLRYWGVALEKWHDAGKNLIL